MHGPFSNPERQTAVLLHTAAKRFSFWRLDTVFLFKKEKNGGRNPLPFWKLQRRTRRAEWGSDYGTQQPALPTAPRHTKTAPALQQALLSAQFT